MTLFNEGNINYWLPTTYSRNINKIFKICKKVEISKLKIITILYYLNNYVPMYIFIIKFRYNARSDWLKQRALSEYRYTE